MTVLYLIRHTQAEGNLYRMMQGHWDGDITALGQAQIDALAERFRTVPLDAVYSSDLRRAVLTAEGAARYSGVSVQTDRRLRELNVGPWEGQFFGNLSHTDPEAITRFMKAPAQWHIDGAETLADVTARAYPALVEIAEKHDAQAIAVVSHGITIRCLLSRILGRPLDGDNPPPIVRNTAVTKLIYDRGTFTAEYLADASHAAHLPMADWLANDGLRDEPLDPVQDLPLYLQCYADAWQNAHGCLAGFSTEARTATVLAHLQADPRSVVKMFNGDEFVGLADFDTLHGRNAGIGWVSFLYLIPSYRHRGYGIQVLARGIRLYRSMGRYRLQLLAGADNLPALSFYKKYGFTALCEEQGACGPLFRMEKLLSEAPHV